MQNEPGPEKPFDHGKWSFWLVAFVLAWLLVMAAGFEAACLIWTLKCHTEGKFLELLTAILSSALAFAAGRSSK